jgi:hypothetical protein
MELDLVDGVGQMVFERINNMIFGYTPVQIALTVLSITAFIILCSETYRLFKRFKS